MTFGRPTMLSTSWDVPVPALIDDEYLNNATEGVQPAGKPSVMGLFISSCNLFELLEEILKSFYSGEPFPDLSKQETASDMAKAFIAPVLQYNRRLDKFIDSVPDYLKLTEYGDGMKFSNNSVTLQQQVLYCRYVNSGRYSHGERLTDLTQISLCSPTVAPPSFDGDDQARSTHFKTHALWYCAIISRRGSDPAMLHVVCRNGVSTHRNTARESQHTLSQLRVALRLL